MRIRLKNGQFAEIRKYLEEDFKQINKLNAKEKWNHLVEHSECTKEAWDHSTVAYVVELNEQFAGYIRGLTDKSVTLFICECLIDPDYRELGIGGALLDYVHGLYPKTRIELLANGSSRTFYEQKGYRAFYGFRKNLSD